MDTCLKRRLVELFLQMSIKGIRAFSPDNDEKITFYKPLTLIVGHNGAGKTVGLCALFPWRGCVLLAGVSAADDH